MTPERWRRIEDLCHAALERDRTLRGAFLHEACAGDEELQREVESLLAEEGQIGSFLEASALTDLAAQEAQAAIAFGSEPAQSPNGDQEASLVGRQLGLYQVRAKIGQGGTGEVYRAFDTKLRRDVALKVLPRPFGRDPERLVRFRREARTLASLNHKNIAAIYNFEELPEANFLVLELVEGETFAELVGSGLRRAESRGAEGRIKQQGPLPIKDALTLSIQIAEGLEAAHRKGITHRDIKLANIKVTPEGVVKVLDFGLAKAFSGDRTNADLSELPPLEPGPTKDGQILGTPAYMSPEQVRGQTVDKQTDIWAFGCVLYELLTGARAFERKTLTDTIAAVLEREPDWQALPAATPAAVRDLLRRCLQKDKDRRLHDIADARIEIDEALAGSTAAVEPSLAVSFKTHGWLVWAMVALAAFMSGRWIGGPQSGETTLWTEILPPVKPFKDVIPAPALSPDGRMIAFNAPDAAGKIVLWVRPLDSPDARALPGTEGSFESFWSPDSRSLAFSANGKLQRIDIAGGDPQFLADTPFFEGGSWAKDGTILFVPTGTTVHRIPASGGTPREVTRLNASRHERIHGWPSFLPDGKHFLLWVFSSERQNEGVYVGALDSGELRPLLPFRTRAQYANGYVFFGRQGNLMAQPFDPDKLQLSGEPKRVAAGLRFSSSDMANTSFSVSNSGGIVWSGASLFFPKVQPTWFDRTGHTVGTLGEPGVYFGVMPSPDGKYAATEFVDLLAQTVDILLLDMAGGNPARLTFVNYWAGSPVWSADSERVLFTQWSDYLDVVSVHGGAPERVPFPGGTSSDLPMGWSSDGQNLLLLRNTQATRSDLWILPLSGDRKPRPYLNAPVNEFDGRISPDGRWVAYATDESGRNEVFVQAFPVPGNKRRISVGGGLGPMWRKDGRELYFVTEDHALMAVNVTAGRDSLEFSPPTRLFIEKDIVGGLRSGWRPSYAPSPDGQRFLVLVRVEDDRPEGLHLIRTWHPEHGK